MINNNVRTLLIGGIEENDNNINDFSFTFVRDSTNCFFFFSLPSN